MKVRTYIHVYVFLLLLLFAVSPSGAFIIENMTFTVDQNAVFNSSNGGPRYPVNIIRNCTFTAGAILRLQGALAGGTILLQQLQLFANSDISIDAEIDNGSVVEIIDVSAPSLRVCASSGSNRSDMTLNIINSNFTAPNTMTAVVFYRCNMRNSTFLISRSVLSSQNPGTATFSQSTMQGSTLIVEHSQLMSPQQPAISMTQMTIADGSTILLNNCSINNAQSSSIAISTTLMSNALMSLNACSIYGQPINFAETTTFDNVTINVVSTNITSAFRPAVDVASTNVTGLRLALIGSRINATGGGGLGIFCSSIQHSTITVYDTEITCQGHAVSLTSSAAAPTITNTTIVVNSSTLTTQSGGGLQLMQLQGQHLRVALLYSTVIARNTPIAITNVLNISWITIYNSTLKTRSTTSAIDFSNPALYNTSITIANSRIHSSLHVIGYCIFSIALRNEQGVADRYL